MKKKYVKLGKYVVGDGHPPFLIAEISANHNQSIKKIFKLIDKISKSGAHAVKLEGGSQIKGSIERILQAGIPVMGHLGLTPQSIYKFGTYTVRAKQEEEAEQLINDAKMLEKVGCFSIVLEKVPAKLAEKISKKISIPVIGIGAGRNVDGQVLVIHDMLGMSKEFNPRFLRRYSDLNQIITDAVSKYSTEVKSEDFPNKEEQY